MDRDLGPSIGAAIGAFDNAADSIDSVGATSEEVAPWYSDQVLPFDVTLAGANEYGAMACAKIFGIEILNEGSGISIDDAVTEMQATFVARAVELGVIVLWHKNHPRAGARRTAVICNVIRPVCHTDIPSCAPVASRWRAGRRAFRRSSAHAGAERSAL